MGKATRVQQKHDTVQTDRLLSAAAAGDQSALGSLVEMHRDYLYRVVDLRLQQEMRSRVDVSDIVQETQLVATKRIEDFVQRRPTSFRLWLRGEAIQQIGIEFRKHVLAQQRSVRRECALSEASGVLLARHFATMSPSAIVARKEFSDRVRDVVDQLPPTDREVVLLRYVEGLNNAEVAELLEIEPDAARKRHGRALRRLMAALNEQGLVRQTEGGQ